MRRRIGVASAEMQAYLGEEPMAHLDRALSPEHDLILLGELFMNMPFMNMPPPRGNMV